jgi:hypothetical protein
MGNGFGKEVREKAKHRIAESFQKPVKSIIIQLYIPKNVNNLSKVDEMQQQGIGLLGQEMALEF